MCSIIERPLLSCSSSGDRIGALIHAIVYRLRRTVGCAFTVQGINKHLMDKIRTVTAATC